MIERTVVVDGQAWRVSWQFGMAVVEVWSVEAAAWLLAEDADWRPLQPVQVAVADVERRGFRGEAGDR